MQRFDLSSLPLCGAQKRSGGTCKRYGNKHNGRCKLHGGHSTGPKTQEGKIKVATNAVKDSIKWFVYKEVDPNLHAEGVSAYNQLVDIESQLDASAKIELVIALVDQHRIALEYVKNIAYIVMGDNAFILVQSALDLYYRNTGSEHLSYHRYLCNPKPPYFAQSRTKEQEKFHLEWIHRDASRARRKGVIADPPKPRFRSPRRAIKRAQINHERQLLQRYVGNVTNQSDTD